MPKCEFCGHNSYAMRSYTVNVGGIVDALVVCLDEGACDARQEEKACDDFLD